MNKKFAQKWVAALRSGDYKQGTNQLCRDGAYCCLGVACEIGGIPKSMKGEGGYPVIAFDGSTGALSDATCKQLGFARGDGARRDGRYITIGGRKYGSLAYANDQGVSFRQIAAWVSRYYRAR